MSHNENTESLGTVDPGELNPSGLSSMYLHQILMNEIAYQEEKIGYHTK